MLHHSNVGVPPTLRKKRTNCWNAHARVVDQLLVQNVRLPKVEFK